MTVHLEVGTLFPLSVCQHALEHAGIQTHASSDDEDRKKPFATLLKRRFRILPVALRLAAVMVRGGSKLKNLRIRKITN